MAEQRLEEVAGVGLGRKGVCIHGRLSRRKQGCEEAKQRTGLPEELSWGRRSPMRMRSGVGRQGTLLGAAPVTCGSRSTAETSAPLGKNCCSIHTRGGRAGRPGMVGVAGVLERSYGDVVRDMG